MVLLSVGTNATTRRLEPAAVLVKYLILMLLAVAIGTLFGFALVPAARRTQALAAAATIHGSTTTRSTG